MHPRIRGSLFTDETQAVVIWVSLDKVHDTSIFHALRYNGKNGGLQRNTNERQDVPVTKPLPPNNLFDEQLGTEGKLLF